MAGERRQIAYIVHRNDHFYVVAYDGVDPITGRERRRWHPASRSSGDAEAIAATPLPVRSELTALAGSRTVGSFLADHFDAPSPRATATDNRPPLRLDHRALHLPRIGAVPLRRLRVDHLDQLYVDLLAHGGLTGTALASKTVYDVHIIVRSALADAARRNSSTSTSR